MWGSDLPHVEGTYPHTREHLAKHFLGVPSDERHAILAGNAARVLGFDLNALAKNPPHSSPGRATTADDRRCVGGELARRLRRR